MKIKFTSLMLSTILFGSVESFAQCASESNVYSFSHGQKQYEVVKQMMNWNDASACAVSRGGRLVEINDNDEQAAIYDAIINGAGVSPTYTNIANGGGIAYVWIGATDQAMEGTWLWDGKNQNSGTNFWLGQGNNGSGDGVSIDDLYHNWGGKSTSLPKEPDNFGTGQHHGAIALSGWPSGSTLLGIPGEWNDIIGSSQLYYVIEKETLTGLGVNEESEVFKLFTSETTGNLFIEGSKLKTGSKFIIYDLMGNVIIKDAIFNKNEINVQSLAQGLYLLKFEDVNHVPVRFIK